MANEARTTDDLKCVLRGIALALGLWANMPFLLFLISSGTRVGPRLAWTSPSGAPLFLVLTLALLGYLVAWRWAGIGGVAAMVSAVALCALILLGSGPDLLPLTLTVCIPMFVAGILFLASRGNDGQPRLTATSQDPEAKQASKVARARNIC